ncbi:3-deoxy-7-phosphoheptulonate synthase [Flintibacter faecis]|uniref:Phospho-2-dehydro-3-deoxyheptonate aldolase n=1 Tax=Flintibacter faecis TaxID=2763047 RepID=A0A8J6M599_9FIRM|nr:3-deoxy-7-phosphoheptulonate synthase [Flintibacter faecis]MBC5716656.1 3-deoxy-7-phosphoheptulonate synthase [Flintibacter faecis]
MRQNARFIRKLPIPMEIKKEFPLSQQVSATRLARVEEMRAILDGRDRRLMLIIGPCSADREDSVMDYVHRLVPVQEQVKDKLLIVPRVYTNKPRTNGAGYKGMLHQPDPSKKPDMLAGIIAIRRLHTRVVEETGFACADEMLYPEDHRYLSDILGYVAVGARSVENQQHRLVASGLDVPVGMKNPTGGDLSVMMNSIYAAMGDHMFLYRGWEVETYGNPYAHAILRGCVNERGESRPNYHYEDLVQLYKLYTERAIKNPACIVDCNHANSGKQYLEQTRIAKEVMHSKRYSADINGLVKGLMIESYIQDGSQKITECTYGKSITDACLGWEKTRQLIFDLAELL